jgi:hypothetical protein
MWQIYEMKVIKFTQGGLTESRRTRALRMKSEGNLYSDIQLICQKSTEVIVSRQVGRRSESKAAKISENNSRQYNEADNSKRAYSTKREWNSQLKREGEVLQWRK